jgi:hypothetical protein
MNTPVRIGWARSAAALLVWLALAAARHPAHAADQPRGDPQAPRIEVVFVLDTTGSMSELLQAAKQQIWSIANELACAKPAPELRIGLVAYRDRYDAYVTRRTDLTTDLDAIYTELVGLQADGGGDEPESVNRALYEAVTEIGWSTDPRTYRAIFLVGDAPPHMDYADDIQYPQSCQLARQRGIALNTIQCGEVAATTPIWTEIAARGDGAFAHLVSNGSAPEITTPYDKGIAVMAKQLDDTRLPYGTDAERATLDQRRERAEHIYDHSSLAAQAARGLFNVTATGKENLYGSKDLLTDCQRGVTKLDDIDGAQLPEPLRSMSAAERHAYLDQQARLREDLELTLQSLAAKRHDYLAKALATHGSDATSLTARIVAAMREQARHHGLELGTCTSTPQGRASARPWLR